MRPDPLFKRLARSGLLAGLLSALPIAVPCANLYASGAEMNAVPGAAGAPPVDPGSGLKMDDNWEIVRAHCGACHSTRLVAQNRGSRENWLQLIRWMQESQGLWPFNEPTEKLLLDYLEHNYGPEASGRRKPLPADLRPPL